MCRAAPSPPQYIFAPATAAVASAPPSSCCCSAASPISTSSAAAVPTVEPDALSGAGSGSAPLVASTQSRPGSCAKSQ